MATKIFVNLPVRDLDKSMAFFKQLGYSFNPQFTDANAGCLVISEDIYAMLLTESRFKDFLSKGKTVSDATKTTEVLLALSCDSKEEVHRLADAAIKAGGSEARAPEDHGFMFARSFHDLDGHVWEVFWMDPSHVMPQQ
ncbi:MAG: glyoxalase [Chitinophagaceae bacterium]|jgi:predicted lactoylglutathione lyase|nr:glyoxalase [Chitinophagaceae bacterium]